MGLHAEAQLSGSGSGQARGGREEGMHRSRGASGAIFPFSSLWPDVFLAAALLCPQQIQLKSVRGGLIQKRERH